MHSPARLSVEGNNMALVITHLATPRKLKVAFLTLMLFAAMC
jgi:hypothetical protein